MRFSDGERFIILMLADLMEGLKHKGEVDPSLVKRLIGGDEWALRDLHSGLFETDSPTPELIDETRDILWMWGIIESAIDKLAGAEAEEASGWYLNKFRGFDGNNDPHFGVAHTLISDLNLFSERKGIVLNSHSQSTLPAYQSMLRKFKGYVSRREASPLSMEALRDLCAHA